MTCQIPLRRLQKKVPFVPPFNDEDIAICPYDMAHAVKTSRLITHLLKCRSNYEKEMKKNGDLPQMVCCKFNWSHQVLFPEVQHHEKYCNDRLSLMTHTIVALQADPENPGKETVVAKYTYSAHGSLRLRKEIQDIELLPEFSNSNPISGKKVNPRPQYIFGAEDFIAPAMRGKTRPSAPAYTFTSEYVCSVTRDMTTVSVRSHSGSIKSVKIVEKSREERAKKKEEREKETSGLLSSSATTVVERSFLQRQAIQRESQVDEYEWERDTPVNSIAPNLKHIVENKQVRLNYPPGLTKSERKEWVVRNVAKIKKMKSQGKLLFGVVPLPYPPDVGGDLGDAVDAGNLTNTTPPGRGRFSDNYN